MGSHRKMWLEFSAQLSPIGNSLDHLQRLPSAGQSKHTVRRESSLRPCHRCVVSDNRIFHACCFHLLQQPGRRLIELSEVASDSETPLRPRHAVGSAAQVDVSAEHRESSNRFRIDTSRPCFHRLLSDLSSLTNKSFRNQRFLRLSQMVLQRASMDEHRLRHHVGRLEHMRFS